MEWSLIINFFLLISWIEYLQLFDYYPGILEKKNLKKIMIWHTILRARNQVILVLKKNNQKRK